MWSSFLFLPTSSKSRMGISRIRGHGGPYRGPKMTRDTPTCAAFCFVCLIMLVWVTPICISLRRMFFLLWPNSSKSSMSPIHGHGGPHRGPKTTRDTPKVAAFCFVRLIMLVWVTPIYISLCRMFFWSDLPHLSLGWAYRPSAALGAPTAAPKRPEIPLRSLRFPSPCTSFLIIWFSRRPSHLHTSKFFS